MVLILFLKQQNLNGTIRTLSKETRSRVESDFRRVVNGVASAMGLQG